MADLDATGVALNLQNTFSQEANVRKQGNGGLQMLATTSV